MPKPAPFKKFSQQPIKYEDIFPAVGLVPTSEDVQGQNPGISWQPVHTLENVQGQDSGKSWQPLTSKSPPVPATTKCLTPAQSRLNTGCLNPSIPVQMGVPRSHTTPQEATSTAIPVSHPVTTPAYVINMNEPAADGMDLSTLDGSVGIAPKLGSRPTSRLGGPVISQDRRTPEKVIHNIFLAFRDLFMKFFHQN